jgi:hypothetical protein
MLFPSTPQHTCYLSLGFLEQFFQRYIFTRYIYMTSILIADCFSRLRQALSYEAVRNLNQKPGEHMANLV